MNIAEFNRNAVFHTWEELAPYIDHYVAWSLDGKKILAAAKDRETLWRETERLGLKPGDFVGDYVPDPDISYVGGVPLHEISVFDFSDFDLSALPGRSDVSL